jgi:hypothetical protein
MSWKTELFIEKEKSTMEQDINDKSEKEKKELNQKAGAVGKSVLIVTIVACFALEIYALIRILLEFMLMGEYFMESIFKTLIN